MSIRFVFTKIIIIYFVSILNGLNCIFISLVCAFGNINVRFLFIPRQSAKIDIIEFGNGFASIQNMVYTKILYIGYKISDLCRKLVLEWSITQNQHRARSPDSILYGKGRKKVERYILSNYRSDPFSAKFSYAHDEILKMFSNNRKKIHSMPY